MTERLKTGKSETNDRQSVTANTQQQHFFHGSCEVTSREANLSLQSYPVGLELTCKGALRQPISERREKPAQKFISSAPQH